MNSQGLAMVNLRLSTVDQRGDPFQAVANYMQAFFDPAAADGGLNALTIDFNVNPLSLKSIERHRQQVDNFVKRMCQYVQKTLFCP
jgi:hypothetical protein